MPAAPRAGASTRGTMGSSWDVDLRVGKDGNRDPDKLDARGTRWRSRSTGAAFRQTDGRKTPRGWLELVGTPGRVHRALARSPAPRSTHPEGEGRTRSCHWGRTRPASLRTPEGAARFPPGTWFCDSVKRHAANRTGAGLRRRPSCEIGTRD